MPSYSPSSERLHAQQKKKLSRGNSASSTDTMYTTSGGPGDDDIQVQRSPQLSPKSVSFMNMESPATTPAVERSQSQAELIGTSTKPPKAEHRKRPSFKRNLSSLWKVLDPPELAHNTGALHNIAHQRETEHWRRRKSASSDDMEKEHTLLATISDKAYKQR